MPYPKFWSLAHWTISFGETVLNAIEPSSSLEAKTSREQAISHTGAPWMCFRSTNTIFPSSHIANSLRTPKLLPEYKVGVTIIFVDSKIISIFYFEFKFNFEDHDFTRCPGCDLFHLFLIFFKPSFSIFFSILR